MQKEALIQEVIRNLKDAGCEQHAIDCFLNELQSGDKEEQLHLLEAHRNCLLNKVHAEERRIDCLDYLIYQIRQDKILL